MGNRPGQSAYLICDGCGVGSDAHAFSWEAFLRLAEDELVGIEVLCPDCVEERELETTE